jgi:hypothetical protein
MHSNEIEVLRSSLRRIETGEWNTQSNARCGGDQAVWFAHVWWHISANEPALARSCSVLTRMQQFYFEGIALRGETTNGKNESRASAEGRSGL